MEIEIHKDGSKLPYYVFINGVILKKSNGVGRNFKSEISARKAAEKEIKNNLK